MSVYAKNTKSTVIPYLRYRDAPAAIKWLCDTFGFETKLLVQDDQKRVMHAELAFGNGMVMIASVLIADSNRLIKQPDEIGGAETQSAYLIVDDADVVHDRANAAGARIVMEIKDEEHGGRGFTCSDPEGHLWNFGTYDPW